MTFGVTPENAGIQPNQTGFPPAEGARRNDKPPQPCSSHRSNNAIDSTCAVCGNMLATPAARSR